MKLTKSKSWIILFIGLLLIVVSVTVIARNDEVKQPIAFNHKKHVDNNVPCNFCHRLYETTRAAGIPSVKVCITCHEDVLYVTPEKAKIQTYYREGKDIPWRRIYQAPDHVFFSHRLHIQKGQVECKQCHGEVKTRVTPFTQQTVPLKMKYCISCHEGVESIDNPYECIRCHH